jgi:hypothetical protein
LHRYVLEARQGATGGGGGGGGGGAGAGPSNRAWRRLYYGIARDYLATELAVNSEHTVRVAAINADGMQAKFSPPAIYRTLDDPTAKEVSVVVVGRAGSGSKHIRTCVP